MRRLHLMLPCVALAAIDRQAVVRRHPVTDSATIGTQLDPRTIFHLGNGGFAVNVDATGLQTLNATYATQGPKTDLNTLSDWGWHSTPGGFPAFTPDTRDAPLTTFNWTSRVTATGATSTRNVTLGISSNLTGPYAGWSMNNPHRLGLGQIALALLTAEGGADPSPIPAQNITNIAAGLDTYAGGVMSAFQLHAAGAMFNVTVNTVLHPDVDMLATSVTCTGGGVPCPLALRLAFPYSTGTWGPSANNWAWDTYHTSTVTVNSSTPTHLTISRVADDAAVTVDCEWDDASWTPVRTGLHTFALVPPASGAASVQLSCLWTPTNLLYPIGTTSSPYMMAKVANTSAVLAARFPLYDDVAAASAASWAAFWASGAFVDLAGSTNDPAAFELERRVVLSRFLLRSSSAGSCPPQETGLFANSWSGKFHLEMRWWHHSSWPLWGNPDLIHRSDGFYFDLLPNATSLASFQGYKGARWLKMLGLTNPRNAATADPIDVPWLGEASGYAPPPSAPSAGRLITYDSANNINPVLVWQQPHMIWLADATRRSINASSGAAAALSYMNDMSVLVFATADFMASFPYMNETSGRYEMGPPLLGAEEFGSSSSDGEPIYRPTFETVYFALGLDIANEWKQLLGLPADPSWAAVSASIGTGLPLDPAMSEPTYSFNAVAACCYIAANKCPPGRFGNKTWCTPQQGHPMPIAVLGMINGRAQGDKYGVTVEVANNTVATIVNDWNWQSGWGWDIPLAAMGMVRLGWAPEAVVDFLLYNSSKNVYWPNGFNYMGQFVYLPGNGGLLSTVAAMAAGMEGGASPAMAFPASWNAQAEGFMMQYP